MSHFDVDGNENNINAIHDSQAVFILQDEDIIIKNEVANDASHNEDDQTNTKDEDDDLFVNNVIANDAAYSGDDKNNSILQKNFTLVPIVYTTRLDEMDIFDKIEKYTPKEAAVLIQYESKPQYRQILPIKREPCGYHSYSFMKLYSDIERLNQKVQIETNIRNEQLFAMCKPLKIVLKDMKYDKAKTTDWESKNFNQTNRKPSSTPNVKKMVAKTKMAETGLVKSVAKFQKLMSIKINDSDDSDSSDDMPLTMLKPCVINSVKILPGTTTIAFIDKTSMKTDIYIINYSKDLRCSYETNSENFYLMKRTSRSKNTVVYDVCCWAKREIQIKLLSQTNIVNKNVISFMRIPHGCLPASCSCCCILDPPMPKQSSVTFQKLSNNKFETNTEASTIIRKAYSCRTKLHSSNVCDVDEPIGILKSAVIMMKYKDILFLHSRDLGESYEIGEEGNIDNHVKITVNRSMVEERELHEKQDREKKICRQYFSYLICCWYKREEIIANLNKAHSLSPRACKYLRNPHLCKSHKCQCCCKLAKTGLFHDAKNIATLPQSKKHSQSVREDKNINQAVTDQFNATKIKKVSVDSKKYIDKIAASRNTVAIEGKNKIKQNLVAVMVSNRKSETVQTNSQTVVKPTIQSQPTAKKVEPPQASAELITTIFDKLKDLKLSVNANGTLTANINTPPEKLLPVEIKVLADILVQASKQMHELGIDPQEYCRRVNSKSLLINANPIIGTQNITLPTKKPFITIPSSLLPQESISPPPLCPIIKKTIGNTKDITQPPQAAPKRFKQKSHSCKTIETGFNFPKTTSSSKAANLLSMMSHTGCIRNKRMIAAYNIHFDLEMDVEPELELLGNTQLINIEEQQLPKIVNVQSLVDTAANTNIISNTFKRKEMQAGKPETKGDSCKIRVLPPEKISAQPINTLPIHKPPINTLPISTQMNMIGLANLATLTKNPIAPMPGHYQENPYGINSNLNLLQCNVNGDLASPLPNAGNNVVLAQGINSGAPSIHIPDSGKIWAFMDGKLVELQRVATNAAIQNIAFNQKHGIPITGTINQTPMITVNNGIPMQVSRLCADTTEHREDVKAPTINEETQESAMNALLRDMLSKESSLPNISQPTAKHRYAKTLKRPVTPLILEHSEEQKLKKRRVLEDVSEPVSKENLQNAVTEVSIEIIDSGEEEESIFGV